MEAQSSIQSESTLINATLAQWRHKATNILLITSSTIFLPIVIILISGKGPPVTWPIKAFTLFIYATLLLDTLAWRIDYRIRITVHLATGYILALLIAVAIPQGPFSRAFPLILPLITIIFFGRKAGQIATVVSILILIFAPLAGSTPSLAGVFITKNAPSMRGPFFLLNQGIAMTAILLEVMVLLSWFHDMLMQSLADRTLAYCKLEEEMKQRRRLEYVAAKAADEERQRLGHEIHDGVCQQITAARLRSEALSGHLAPSQTKALEELSELSTLLGETIDEARAVAHGLCPLDSKPDAFIAALQTFVNRIRSSSGVECTLQRHGDVAIKDTAIANHLYRIAQEAIANAAKHSRAKRISVVFHGYRDFYLLEVEDDGIGLQQENTTEGMGLRIMFYRANLIESNLSITPGEKGGTRIVCQTPRGVMIDSTTQNLE